MRKLFFLFAILVSWEVNAQTDSTKFLGQTVYPIYEASYLSGGAGTSIILGDVAPLPKFTLKQNTNIYKFGYMLRFGKRITRGFNVNLEILKGTVGGSKEKDAAGTTMDMTFKGDYWAATINIRLDVLKFFYKTRFWPFSVYGRIGAGPAYYRALMTHLSTGAFFESAGYDNEGQTKSKRWQTTFVPIGFGGYYDFSDNLRAEVGVDMYNSFTDFLDAHHGISSDYNDKILVIGASVVYCFDWK
jgi:hypothetical protein